MSEKTTKKDPLLDDESPKTKGQPAKAGVEKPAEPVAKPPVKPATPAQAEAVLKDQVALTKAKLEKAPQVDFIIPVAEGETPGACETVQINGYRLTIMKGTLVKVPLPVANLLAEKYRIAMTAGTDKRIDRASNVQDALS